MNNTFIALNQIIYFLEYFLKEFKNSQTESISFFQFFYSLIISLPSSDFLHIQIIHNIHL